MEEDNDLGKKILAEAKTFHFFPYRHGFILKELFKHGERDLFITVKQSIWIVKGLKARSKSFGNNKRRESRVLDGAELVLIEGSNQKGIFLSIQVKISGKDDRFVVIPAGRKGKHWYRTANLMKSVPRQEKQNWNINFGSQGSQSLVQTRSYADALRSSSMAEAPIESMNLLLHILDSLEKEVVSLQSKVEFLSSLPQGKDSVKPSEQRPAAEAAATPISEKTRSSWSPEQVPAEAAAKTPISEKTMSSWSVGWDPNNLARFRTQELPDSIMLDFCKRMFDEFVSYLRREEADSDPGIKNCSNVTHSPTINSEDLNENLGSPDLIPRVMEESITEDSFVEEEVNDSTSSIFWDEEKEVYAHSCGMMHDPLRNTYFSKIGVDPNDLRSLYFVPKDGVLQLALDGKLGAINKKISLEEGLELSKFSPKWHSIPPTNLVAMFRKKSIENDMSTMSPYDDIISRKAWRYR